MNVCRWPWPTWIVALVLVTNAIALGGAWWNRMAPAEATLVLTGRDVEVMNAIRDAAPIDASRRPQLQLSIRYANAQYRPPGSPSAWFSAAHLRANGLEVPSPTPSHGGQEVWHRSHQTLLVYVVLEHDGLAYQDEYHRQCETPIAGPTKPPAAEGRVSPRCEQLREDSRLYVMDVGANRQQLRDQYPDRTRYAVVHASLRIPSQEDEWSPLGSVHLLQPMIAIDDQWRSSLPELLRQPGNTTHLRVAFGRSLEPWLIALSADPLR